MYACVCVPFTISNTQICVVVDFFSLHIYAYILTYFMKRSTHSLYTFSTTWQKGSETLSAEIFMDLIANKEGEEKKERERKWANEWTNVLSVEWFWCVVVNFKCVIPLWNFICNVSHQTGNKGIGRHHQHHKEQWPQYRKLHMHAIFTRRNGGKVTMNRVNENAFQSVFNDGARTHTRREKKIWKREPLTEKNNMYVKS